MDKKECEVCNKLVKEKYKHYKTWRNLAIVFMCLTVFFAIMYFSSGNMMVEETIENDIQIENQGGNNENTVITGDGSTISGTITTESESNIGGIIVLCVLILTGGIVCGCYLISQKKDNK
jgi:hypothetical protein